MNIEGLGDRPQEVPVIYDKHFWHKQARHAVYIGEALSVLAVAKPVYAAVAGRSISARSRITRAPYQS